MCQHVLIYSACFSISLTASLAFIGESQPPHRKLLAIYPVFLFYFVIGWMIISRTGTGWSLSYLHVCTFNVCIWTCLWQRWGMSFVYFMIYVILQCESKEKYTFKMPCFCLMSNTYEMFWHVTFLIAPPCLLVAVWLNHISCLTTHERIKRVGWNRTCVNWFRN